MQGIILAAGMGKRLKDLTKDVTKCMVKVNGITLIERMLLQLEELKLDRIILVVGYKKEKLMDYINSLNIKTPIIFVHNDIYYRTNNIYSLYLAKDYLLENDTLLLESDLIFDKIVLKKIYNSKEDAVALVSKFKSWMDGTVVTLDYENNIINILSKKEFLFEDKDDYYKTVNIYKFGKKFSEMYYVPFLEAYSKALGNNEYYEQVLRVIVSLDRAVIKGLKIEENELWYEIDNIQDLNIAESLFAEENDKFKKYEQRYGGYWRYPELLDFCYLVNPFYPNKKLISEMKSNFENLLKDYPSGLEVNNILAANFFGIKKEFICIGNGAAELIKILMDQIDGKIGIIYPTFQEYPNRKNKSDIVPFYVENYDFKYNAKDIQVFFEKKNIESLLIINPDNPSGNLMSKEEILSLVTWGKQAGINIILDESFIDFADDNVELLDNKILAKNENLIIVKSISKTYGVPGLRLGIIATSNESLLSRVRNEVSIWNINSFGEFYLQIAEKYNSYYEKSLEKIKVLREKLQNALNEIDCVRVIKSQANYIMCEILYPYTSKELTKNLLNKYNILIKDLSNKEGLNNKQYIRLAIKTPEENNILIDAIKNELS